MDNEGFVSNGNGYSMSQSQKFHQSRRMSWSRRFSNRRGSGETSITSVVSNLKRQSAAELGPDASSKLFSASYLSLIEWIRNQRMTLLPAEGSDYDKVLSWAQLFVDRLNSFDLAIEEFASDSYLASQLSYGHCAMLLEVRTLFYAFQAIDRV